MRQLSLHQFSLKVADIFVVRPELIIRNRSSLKEQIFLAHIIYDLSNLSKEKILYIPASKSSFPHFAAFDMFLKFTFLQAEYLFIFKYESRNMIQKSKEKNTYVRTYINKKNQLTLPKKDFFIKV